MTDYATASDQMPGRSQCVGHVQRAAVQEFEHAPHSQCAHSYRTTSSTRCAATLPQQAWLNCAATQYDERALNVHGHVHAHVQVHVHVHGHGHVERAYTVRHKLNTRRGSIRAFPLDKPWT